MNGTLQFDYGPVLLPDRKKPGHLKEAGLLFGIDAFF
jgi:hypothetical protein